MDKFIERVKETVKETLKNNKDQSVAHQWNHIWRVYKRSIKIAEQIKNENIDLEVLKLASLLHDIDEPYYDKKNHIEKSIKKAKTF